MSDLILAFLAGLVVIPIGVAVVAGVYRVGGVVRWAVTKPVDLAGATLRRRRSAIVMMTLEMLDARHVRAIRVPFGRLFIIRTNPLREYDFCANNYVPIGDDYGNAESLIGRALDELGYEIEEDAR